MLIKDEIAKIVNGIIDEYCDLNEAVDSILAIKIRGKTLLKLAQDREMLFHCHDVDDYYKE